MVDHGYAENEQAHRRSVSDRTRRKTYARSSSRRNVFPSGGPLRLHRIPLAQKRRRLLDPESGLPRRTHRPFREASDYSGNVEASQKNREVRLTMRRETMCRFEKRPSDQLASNMCIPRRRNPPPDTCTPSRKASPRRRA